MNLTLNDSFSPESNIYFPAIFYYTCSIVFGLDHQTVKNPTIKEIPRAEIKLETQPTQDSFFFRNVRIFFTFFWEKIMNLDVKFCGVKIYVVGIVNDDMVIGGDWEHDLFGDGRSVDGIDERKVGSI